VLTQGKDATRAANERRCCAVGECCEAFLSTRTVSDVRAALRSALSSAISRELVTRNVATAVKLPSGRKRRRKAWSSDEARAFLESARADGDAMYAAYVLVLVLGLRRGEVLGLVWDDLDLDQGELARVTEVCREQKFTVGQYVFKEGEPGNRLFLISEG